MAYQHKSIQKLAELYEEHNEELSEGFSMEALTWKALSPNIPDYLEALDTSPEFLAKIKNFLETIVGALEEDVGNA